MIRRVGVCGCGLMGSGIAATAVKAGFMTIVREVTPEILEAGKSRVADSLGRMKAMEASKNLTWATDLAALADCDLVIEAIVENANEKKTLFALLDAILSPRAILATNTSSLSITDLAAATKRPDRFLGMHFFNPVPKMPLVELARGLGTTRGTLDIASEFVGKLGKTPIVAPDAPGFIVNRLLVPFLLDAVRCLEQGLATKEDIDAGMKLGCAHPMGPLELLDFVGLDTTLYIAEILFDAFRESRFAPPVLLKRMVAGGRMGKKSGEGFYKYGGGIEEAKGQKG